MPLADLNLVENKLRIARLGSRDAEATYRKAKLDLGSLMNLTLDEIATLELRGTIDDLAPPPPPVAELQKIALAERPDIASFRFGVSYAQSRRPSGQGQRLQRCLPPLAALYVSGQRPLRLEKPDLLGPRRDRSHAHLQPKPGRDRAGQDQRDSIGGPAFRRRNGSS